MSASLQRSKELEAVLDGLVTPAALFNSEGGILLLNAAAEAWLFECGLVPGLRAGMRHLDLAQLPRDAVRSELLIDGQNCLLAQRPATSLSIEPISGLPNAAAAFTTLTKTLSSSHGLGGRLAVIHLSCDLVRRIGASVGRHDALELERVVGQRVRRLARRGDYACSLGQGVYVVLSVGCDQLEDAWSNALRWVEALGRPFIVQGREMVCGVSAGVAVAPEHGTSPAELLDHAASAAQNAVLAGRGEVRAYSESIAQLMAEDIELENALAQAIDRRELSLVFQPKVWTDGQREWPVGAECLVRWTHPLLGPVSPARFIPLAERCGLMGALGDWILEQCCRQIAEWREAGRTLLPVAVNVSSQQLLNKDFRWKVESCLRRYALSTAEVALEITESALLQDVDESIRLMASLREMGMKIAIDDFGTGFSSLAYLRRFPCDLLKIDKTFVDGIEDDAQAAGILAAIVAMAETLNMQVIVEGVESPAQHARLLELGCVLFQGYLFGRPERADSFASRWLPGAEAEWDRCA